MKFIILLFTITILTWSINGHQNDLECLLDIFESSAKFTGQVYIKGDEYYHHLLDNLDNQRIIVYPLVIVEVFHESDISIVMYARKKCGIEGFSVLSGGHSAAGYSLSEGVVVSLRKGFADVKMNCLQTTNCYSIEAGAGALWSNVYSYLKTKGNKITIGGGCPGVGLGGFLLGGGFSFLSRSYGLGSDSIESLRMVLANGTAITVSENENEDLFWASQGGGGGNFGVVTTFNLTIHDTKTKLQLTGELCWPPFERDVIIRIWKTWFDNWSTMPDWIDIDPVWLPINHGAEDPRMFCLTVICNNEKDLCENQIAPYVREKPTLNSVEYEHFVDWQLANVNITSAQEGLLYLTSGYFDEGALTINMIEQLMDALQAAPSSRNLVLFHIGGGQITAKSPTETAYVHRQAQLLIQIKAIWTDISKSKINMDWVKSTRALVSPQMSGSYINYIDKELSDWENNYYGENLARLSSLKRQYDPENFFQFSQSIPQ